MSKSINRGGIFRGKSHAQGGIPLVVKDSGQKIEVEGQEALIPAEVKEDPNTYVIEGTNKEVLDKVLKKSGAEGISKPVSEVQSGDMVTCVRSTNDTKKHKYKGTLKQIVSKVNESGGCNPIHEGGEQVFDDGGSVGNNQNENVLDSILNEAKPFIEEIYNSELMLKIANF
jgi:hypothetical protein